jgi:hypothetical protein
MKQHVIANWVDISFSGGEFVCPQGIPLLNNVIDFELYACIKI